MLLFSDLHLSPKTFDTSMAVLRRVHKEALSKNISIGFLGDFFDHVYNKGTLPVDILNDLLRFFSEEWSVPMIMIPGNHDYFDASETEHGLTPFKYASNHITIVDEPKVIDGCLWMPWRRDHVQCKRIIDKYPDVKAIFGHFDIIGFKLNAKKISTEGLSLDMFPKDIPIYTGHYHTPQTYNNIRYLGSPYQLTLSEAEDKKGLVLLSSEKTFIGTIPISIGPKLYKWNQDTFLCRHTELNENDRLSVPEDESTVHLISEVRKRGVIVHIKREIKMEPSRIAKSEHLTETELLRKFAQIQGIDCHSESFKLMYRRLKMTMTAGRTPTQSNNVIPHKMTIVGFGPFAGPLTLALNGQGFTLVSGADSETSGSNGTGKSMITAGALLWVCSGLLDGRCGMTFENGSSVIHSGHSFASVTLSGVSENKPFEITRTISAQPKKHTIEVKLNGENITRSTITATQRAIASDIFGLDISGSELWNWLLRHCCWSQQSVVRFCNANDTQAKKEIQTLANMDLWVTLSTWAKEEFKKTKQNVEYLENEVNRHSTELEKAIQNHSRKVRLAYEWQIEQLRRIEENQKDIESMQVSVDRAELPSSIPMAPNSYTLKSFQRNLRDARDCLIRSKTRLKSIQDTLPENWEAKQHKKFEDIEYRDIERLEQRADQCKITMAARRAQMTMRREQYETFKNKGICSACHRPFDDDPNRHEHLSKFHQELETSRMQHAKSVSTWKYAVEELQIKKKSFRDYTEYLNILEKVSNIRHIQKEIAQSNVEELQTTVRSLTETYENENKAYMEYKQLERVRDDLNRALQVLIRIQEEISLEQNPHDISEENIDILRKGLQERENEVAFKRIYHQRLKQIIKWSGPRGIQTYVMENCVQKLAGTTTFWLQRFFGPDARLICSFDAKERLQREVIVPGFTGVMSGGQWRRVELASFMAWRSMKSDKWPLLIMDECCTSMDQLGIRQVQETLREWCEEDSSRTCYFITHEPGQHRDTSIYQNHMQIQRKRGRSSLVDIQPHKKQRK